MTTLPIPLCMALETALNAMLRLDEEHTQKAAPLTGKTIQFDISDLGLRFYLAFTNRQTIQVLSFHEDPDVTIIGTSVNLAKMSSMEDANSMVLSQQVTISGDVGTVSQVEKYLAAIDIDWEEHLSRLTGDLLAHKIGNGVRSAMAWLQGTAKSLSDDVSEYARYEAEWLPDTYQRDQFVSAVNQIRNDVDRLEARIKRFAHKLSQ